MPKSQPWAALLAPVAAIVIFFAPAAARADRVIDDVNARYATIRPERRSDLVLLPLLAKTTPPPAAVDTITKAKLLPASSPAFAAAAQWATTETSKAALEGLAKIAVGATILEGFAFGQPYGDQAVVAEGPVGLELVRAGLFTDLGDPPLLAAARHGYLPALDRLSILAHVEATRLAAEANPAKAVSVLTDLVFFGRQMADRHMLAEARWGYTTMSGALERIRDVVYLDFRSGSPKLTPEAIGAAIDRLREDGFIRTDLLVFPQAHAFAAIQLINLTLTETGADPARFSTTMSRVASSDQPLRLFAEAARWDALAPLQGNRELVIELARQAYRDWNGRWPLDYFDRANAIVPVYNKLPKTVAATVLAAMPDMGVLFNDRQVLRTQLVGTRTALGLVGVAVRTRTLPAQLEAIRPRFVQRLEADPFNPNRAAGREPPLEFFVPVRDAGRGAPGPGPHQVNVITPGQPNFRVNLDQTNFILYSVGPNGQREFARDVSGEPEANAIGDLLIWPPVLSLVRQRLIETGELK